MGLRDALKATLSRELQRCTPYAVQPCNSVVAPATGDATPMQLRRHQPMANGAIDDATTVQLGGCSGIAPHAEPAPPVARLSSPEVHRTCTDCMHLLRRGTCGEPVAAGLLAGGFSIVWPPDGHATGCGAFIPKPVPAPAERPYRLSAADADRCHAGAWDEGETGRFVARVSLFLRRGVGAEDADDLAERLVLRDRDGDDQRACVECRNLAGHVSTGLRCLAARAAGVGSGLPTVLVMQQQRCPGFGGAVLAD